MLVRTPRDLERTRATTPAVPRARTADAATLLAIYVLLQFTLPTRLVLNGLPLSLTAAAALALGMGTLWLCAQCTTTLGAAKGRSPVRTTLLAYVAVLLAAYASAAAGYLPSDERSLSDHVMVTVLAPICVGLIACDGVRSRARIYFLLRTIVVCTAFIAVIGVLQYSFNFDLTPHLRPPGMHFSSFESSRTIRDGQFRAFGTTDNPIEYGVVLAMVLPIAIHLAFGAPGSGRKPSIWWAFVGLIAGGVLFSVSRSAIIAVVSATLVLVAGWPRRRRLAMAVAGVGLLAFAKVTAPGLLGTFLNLFRDANKDSSVQWRTLDYATAHELISQHPWLGRGIGTWYAPKHQVFDNQYLLTLVDTGAIGLVAVISIVLGGLYAAIRVLVIVRHDQGSRGPSRQDRDLALAFAASLAIVLPAFATFDFLAFKTVSSLMFLTVGLAGALLRIVRADLAGERPDTHAIV